MQRWGYSLKRPVLNDTRKRPCGPRALFSRARLLRHCGPCDSSGAVSELKGRGISESTEHPTDEKSIREDVREEHGKNKGGINYTASITDSLPNKIAQLSK